MLASIGGMKSRLVTFSAWNSGLNDKLASGNPLLKQVFKILPCAEAAFPQQAFKLRWRGCPALPRLQHLRQ